MGFAAGWYLCWKWPRAGRAWQLPAALTRWRDRVLVHWRRAVPPPALPVAAAPAEPLSTRLHRLQAVLIPAADNSAHPRELEDQAEFRLAVRLLQDASVSLDTVLQYAFGANWALSCAALAALSERGDREAVVNDIVANFSRLVPWAMFFALKFIAAATSRPDVGAPLVGAKDWWGDNVVLPFIVRDYLAQRERQGDRPTFGTALQGVPQASIALIKAFLGRVNHPFAVSLSNELRGTQTANVDRAFLTSFGRFWTSEPERDPLIEPEDWREALASAAAAAREAAAPTLLLSAEHRVGKTSFLRLLGERLAPQGWEVFEAGGADIMAGQMWFGQLEGRIQKTVEELAASKKVIWYIPDMLAIALSGTHQGQAASILDQILPAITAGRLVVWAEASSASTARLLRVRPALRSAFEVIRLEPQSQEATTQLANALIERLSSGLALTIDPACVATAMSSARQYMNAASLPGSVLDLLKLTVSRTAKSEGQSIGPEHVIGALSQLTGLPVSILDHRETVNLATIREYFSARVIGQDEAVSAVVERIAMLKAGLNDPGKPIGVFLFAGPTGTGKTELAKTLAQFLFASVDRLLRLDMSEFQTSDSTVKILGSNEGPGNTDSLITRVRKQPFSVVLLDEFEKAHANVWDLFLQVFDDGRLTDQLGHVADFRHCIIILTTNLGATAHRGTGLGFATTADAFSSDQIMRAIAQTFRPEFQNRLDKVIVFHPLTRDLMRDILKKELGMVLERRGLKDRDWAVEWEASAQAFLLEKGFTPEMGARPLKRAIDQYVMAPLAATIVEKRFPEGDQFVFVRSDGRAIQAEFVDPDSEAPSPAAPTPATQLDDTPALPAMVLTPRGTPTEVTALGVEYDGVSMRLQAQDWDDLRDKLSGDMQAVDFWTQPGRLETLSRLALMDRVKAAMSTAQSLRNRLVKGQQRAGKSSRELVARLALQLHLIKQGVADVFEAAPIEVALAIEPSFERTVDSQATRDWCNELAAMYRAWANNRHMQLAEIAANTSRNPPLLLISGFGAHRVLAQEAGLHVLELADDDKRSSRVTARVRLAVVPLQDHQGDRLRKAVLLALEQAQPPHAVVRRYRNAPAPLVRSMNGGWRTGRVDAVLRGDFDLIAAMQG
jgi:ATP-dependent Clp protease ATP-binding subunit ClpC